MIQHDNNGNVNTSEEKEAKPGLRHNTRQTATQIKRKKSNSKLLALRNQVSAKRFNIL